MSGEALNDKVWTARCLARMIEIDPELKPSFAEPIALDLCSRARWRAMEPEAAAQVLFDHSQKR